MSAVATPLVFTKTNIIDTVRIDHPTKTVLKAVKTTKDLEDTKVGRRASITRSRYVIIPPFLTKTLVESEPRDPASLYLKVLDTINAFDTNHEDESEFSTAIEDSFNVLIFLWAIHKS